MAKKQIIDLQIENLEVTRILIISLIDRLGEVIKNKEFTSEMPLEWKYIWGEKESAVSILSKLTGLLIKVVPMEKKLLDSKAGEKKANVVNEFLTNDDKEIIKRYLERYNCSKENV
jgi:hypothetical protein